MEKSFIYQLPKLSSQYVKNGNAKVTLKQNKQNDVALEC